MTSFKPLIWQVLRSPRPGYPKPADILSGYIQRVCWQHGMPLPRFRIEEMSYIYLRSRKPDGGRTCRKSRVGYNSLSLQASAWFYGSLVRSIMSLVHIVYNLALRILFIDLKPCKLAAFTFDGVSSVFSLKMAGALSVITLLPALYFN